MSHVPELISIFFAWPNIVAAFGVGLLYVLVAIIAARTKGTK